MGLMLFIEHNEMTDPEHNYFRFDSVTNVIQL